jgi:hypothetical protein
MGVPTFYLFLFGDLTQRSFYGGFHMFIDYKNFLKFFLAIGELWVNQNTTKSELKINYELIKN